MAGTRFGRNIPLDQVRPVTDERADGAQSRARSAGGCSRASRSCRPTTVNTLAAAWLQFMIRDWFTHGEGDTSRLMEIPLAPGDPWRSREDPMRIPRDPPRPHPARGCRGPDHVGQRGDPLVGRVVDLRHRRSRRSRRCAAGVDGKLRLTDDGQIPIPDDPERDFTTRSPAGGPGWACSLTLFAREHNAVCDRLKSEYPHWDGRGAVPARPAGRRRAAGQDPHGRVDAGRHQPPDDGLRAAGQLVRGRRGADRPLVRPDQRQRGGQRHPGRGDRALRRAVLAHRGVHRRLPDAPADARRLRPPVARRRQAAGAVAASASWPGRTRRRSVPRFDTRRPVLLVRHHASRCDRAAQLPAVPAGVRAARRQGRSTSPPPTSSASGSSASRGTASSAGCCT